MSEKIVVLTITARFVGDYYDASEVAGVLEEWIDSGLEDRDDLVGWTIRQTGETHEEASLEE